MGTNHHHRVLKPQRLSRVLARSAGRSSQGLVWGFQSWALIGGWHQGDRWRKKQEKLKCKCQRKLKRCERASRRSGGQQVAMLLAWSLQRCPNICRGCWDDPPLTVRYCGRDQLLRVPILMRTKRTPTELCKVLAHTNDNFQTFDLGGTIDPFPPIVFRVSAAILPGKADIPPPAG